MRVYLDSSAAIKRVVAEPRSDALVSAVDRHHAQGDLLVSSSLAWVEVARALRRRAGAGFAEVAADVDDVLSGVAEHPIGAEVVSLARRVRPHVLRSLDAVHLASALLVDADLLLTYDRVRGQRPRRGIPGAIARSRGAVMPPLPASTPPGCR